MSLKGTAGFLGLLMASARGSNSERSGDIHAHKWLTPEIDHDTQQAYEEYKNVVDTGVDIILSARNRYYMDIVKKMPAGSQVILVAAGFVSYVFTGPNHLRYFELDVAEVIETKSSFVSRWKHEGLLPHRDVTYIPLHFDWEQMEDAIGEIPRSDIKRCYIFEGISGYLPPSIWQNCMSWFSRSLRQGDVLAFDFLDAKDADKSSFHHFRKFCGKWIGMNDLKLNFLNRDEIKAAFPSSELHFSDCLSEAVRFFDSKNVDEETTINDRLVSITSSKNC